MLLKGLLEVIGMLIAYKFDAKVLNHKSEGDWEPHVPVEAWHEVALMVACFLEAFLE